MSLFEIIKKDMYKAMKSGNRLKSTALRSAMSKIKDKQIEKKDSLKDEEIIKVLKTMVKQRKESIVLYKKANRNELADEEKKEKKIYEEYLPIMLSDEEVEIIVKDAINDVNAKSMKDIGKVMPEIMKKGKGLIDGKLAQQIVQKLLM